MYANVHAFSVLGLDIKLHPVLGTTLIASVGSLVIVWLFTLHQLGEPCQWDMVAMQPTFGPPLTMGRNSASVMVAPLHYSVLG